MNLEVNKEIIDTLKLNVVSEKVQQPIPVLISNPKILKNGFSRSSSAVTTGAVSISAAVNGTVDNDWYLTSLTLALIKDATCDVGTGNLAVTVQSVEYGSVNITGLPVLTTTAQNTCITFNFSHPIHVSRNTSVSWAGTFTAGAMSRLMQISGFIEETR